MGRIQFTEDAWDDYLYWIGCDKKTVRKINQLINDILRNGFHEGIGSPEALKGNLSGQYSRRINEKDRLVYRDAGNGEIEITSCKDHYDDK